MNSFSIKVKKEWFGKRLFIELRTGKYMQGDSRVEALRGILLLLRNIWLEVSPSLAAEGLKNIKNQLRGVMPKILELQSIYDTLNGPCHGSIPGDEQNRLIAKEKEIRAELKKVSV